MGKERLFYLKYVLLFEGLSFHRGDRRNENRNFLEIKIPVVSLPTAVIFWHISVHPSIHQSVCPHLGGVPRPDPGPGRGGGGTPASQVHLRYPPSELAGGYPLLGGYPTLGTPPQSDLAGGGVPPAGGGGVTSLWETDGVLDTPRSDFLVLNMFRIMLPHM